MDKTRTRDTAQAARTWTLRAAAGCATIRYRLALALAGEGRAMPTVMVVEDDAKLLSRFCRIIAADPELELFAAVGSLAAALQVVRERAPDILVTDLGLPDGSGIELIRETARLHPATDVMVITVFGDEQHVLQSIEAGATGYIIKDSLPDEFRGLIKQLVDGGSPISPVIARQLLKRFRGAPAEAAAPTTAEDAGLSPRESEVLSLIAKGFSFGEIAKLLGVSQHTITTHVKKIYQKLAVHSRGEAVYEAGKMGLL
ncbi:response regulator transcription factor [Roseateles saccharophilus]